MTKAKRKKPTKITPELRAAIGRDLVNRKLSQQAIAKKHGVSIGPVRTIARTTGRAPSTEPVKPAKVSVLDQALARIEGRSVMLSADLYVHLESIAQRRKCSVEALTGALLRTALVL